MSTLQLPAPDRVLSPRTGWSRDHWITVADHLLDSLRPWFSANGARIDLPGRQSWSGRVCDGLEGFARSFLLAAFRIAGTEGVGCEALISRYSHGLVAGADVDGPEAWPRLTPCSQQMVEAAAIAIGLHESRRWLWDRLDARDQQKIIDWLSGFVGSRTWDSNWRLFQVVGEQFLASVGADYAPDDIDQGLDRLESWYRGGGWYSDGDGQNYDYYAGFVLHSYPLFWSRIAAATPGTDYGERLDTYKQRLSTFLEGAVHLVGSDGAPIHHGRSLCYRMGMLAPYWMGALVDATPLEPGATRRLCSGTLRHFVEHQVPDTQGLLSLGWYARHLPTTQAYSGPGSPYWASKGFAGLLLPAEHPVWTATERALPQDLDDHVTALRQPGFLLQSTKHDGIVRLLNHGSDHLPLPLEGDAALVAGDSHYDRLAYSSRTGPDVSPRAERLRVDNQLVILGPGHQVSRRGHIRRITVQGPFASSWSTADTEGVPLGSRRVETASLTHGPWEIRCSLVEGAAGDDVRHGGYAVAEHTQPEAGSQNGPRPYAFVTRPDGLTSAMIGLSGYQSAAIHRDVDANAFGPHSATPYLKAGVDADAESTVLVAAAVLSGDSVWPEAISESIEVHVRGTRVGLAFADGTRATINLGTDPVGPRCSYTPSTGEEEVVTDD